MTEDTLKHGQEQLQQLRRPELAQRQHMECDEQVPEEWKNHIVNRFEQIN